MRVDEKVLDRLDELIAAGDVVIGTRQLPPTNSGGFDSTVNPTLAYQWFTSAQNILVRVFGPGSEHYKNFSAQNEKRLTYKPVLQAQGVLKAAREDYANGHLFELRRLVQAEVFDDFLEQAESLLAAGYHPPAAVVGGCVLEDGLKKLAGTNGVELPENPKLDRVNAELAKAGVYNKLTQKRITAIADLRNNAAHGKWDEFQEQDVADALTWIRSFMEGHFG
ncbi:MAG TPA: hypothetical protein VF039_00355 [Longimicrobiales bacterium]